MTRIETTILMLLLTITGVALASMVSPIHELRATLENREQVAIYKVGDKAYKLEVKTATNTGKLQQSADNKVVNMQVTRGAVYLQRSFDSNNIHYVILGEF